MTHGPTDWTTGERVFAPPSGTVDVDWLLPALLERSPATTPGDARAALAAAWSALRAEEPPPTATPLERDAADVVLAARRDFRA